MTSRELVQNASAYLSKVTCYLKGCWGQKLTQSVYQDKLRQYPENTKYNNAKYVGTDAYPFDCICFIKSLIAGGTVNNRLNYTQLSAGPLGDCTNQKFYDSLYDCVPVQNAPAGYGLATTGHAALCLGNNQWIDVNFSGNQNGAGVHSGWSGTNFKCGKIPGITYEEPAPSPVPSDQKKILTDFCSFLIDLYLSEVN